MNTVPFVPENPNDKFGARFASVLNAPDSKSGSAAPKKEIEPEPASKVWQPPPPLTPDQEAEQVLESLAPIIEKYAVNNPDVALALIEKERLTGRLTGEPLEVAFALIPFAQRARADRLAKKEADFLAREQRYDELEDRVYQAEDALEAATALPERAKALVALRKAQDEFLEFPNPREQEIDLNDPDRFPEP